MIIGLNFRFMILLFFVTFLCTTSGCENIDVIKNIVSPKSISETFATNDPQVQLEVKRLFDNKKINKDTYDHWIKNGVILVPNSTNNDVSYLIPGSRNDDSQQHFIVEDILLSRKWVQSEIAKSNIWQNSPVVDINIREEIQRMFDNKYINYETYLEYIKNGPKYSQTPDGSLYYSYGDEMILKNFVEKQAASKSKSI